VDQSQESEERDGEETRNHSVTTRPLPVNGLVARVFGWSQNCSRVKFLTLLTCGHITLPVNSLGY
jgi:hypothetical protein